MNINQYLYFVSEVRKSTEWTSWARVNETREGRIERRYKVVCKANIPEQTDLRVQVKTNERFCSAGNDDTCAGERNLDLGGDGGNLDLAAPGLEPLLVLLANAVCTNSVVDDDKCCDNLVDNSNDTSKMSTNTTKGVNSTGLQDTEDNFANNTGSKLKEENINTFINFTNSTSLAIEEKPIAPVTSKPSFSSPIILTTNKSSGGILLNDTLNINPKSKSFNSTSGKAEGDKLSDRRNSTSNVTSQKLQDKKEAIQRAKEKRKAKVDETKHHVQSDNHKNCNCPEPKRNPRPPWSNNDVFKGYCKCRDLGIFRTCRRCKTNIPSY